MALPYNPTSPEETETIKNSQSKILENFQSIKTIIEQNHVAFGESLQGCHKYVIMPNASVPSDSDPATDPTDLRLFARVDSGPNFPQLWLKYPDNTLSQLTGDNSASTGTSGTGWSKFPSGVIMKWGTATISATTSVFPVVFPVGASIPVFTKTAGYIKITPTSTGASTFNKVYVANKSATGFSAGGELNTSFTINWFAIGV